MLTEWCLPVTLRSRTLEENSEELREKELLFHHLGVHSSDSPCMNDTLGEY